MASANVVSLDWTLESRSENQLWQSGITCILLKRVPRFHIYIYTVSSNDCVSVF